MKAGWPALVPLRGRRAVLFLLCLLSVQLQAAVVTQTLQLEYGWNAVWLEVGAADAAGNPPTCDQVFLSPDFVVDQVASPIERLGTAEFSASPETLFDQGGWSQWKLNPGSDETDLILCRANHGYLVHVSPTSGVSAVDGAPAGALDIAGEVDFYRPVWVKGGFNLVGFGVRGDPAFSAFLSGSGISVGGFGVDATIQELDSATGQWKAVKAQDPVTSGKAYWINVPYDLPGNGWTGPVETDFPGAVTGTWNFGPGPGSLPVSDPNDPTAEAVLLSPSELTFSNVDASAVAPVAVTIKRLLPAASDPAANDLVMSALEPVPEELAWQKRTVDFVAGWQAASLPGGDSRTVTVGVLRDWNSGLNYREQLYEIDVALPGGGSTHRYLPVVATNEALSADTSDTPPPDTFTGLWVGQVTLDAVTSLSSAGQPVQGARSQLPMRIMIHVDAAGRARLLTRGILMQTRTASDRVEATTVLVVDETKIPFFEGIRQRPDGQRSGLRLTSVAYDLPRKLDVSTLSARLLQAVSDWKAALEGGGDSAAVTEADVVDYVDTLTARPPDLPETYYLSWPLAGELGVGRVLETAAAEPLRLDPFHRSNPFRHAFNPQHRVGYAVTRAFRISFDAAPDAQILTGTYAETTRGLARDDLESRGTIDLRRVSLVDSLQ